MHDGGTRREGRREALDEPRLRQLVERGLTIRAIASGLDRTPAGVRYWLGRFGLRTAAAQRRSDRRPVPGQDGRLIGHCHLHGRTEFVPRRGGSARCARCRSEQVTRWRRRLKARLVAEAGGACAICGYSRSTAALQFHHLDPGAKAFSLSQEGVTRSLSRARAEAAKCALLCANCHAEVEAGAARLPATFRPLGGPDDPG